VITDPVECEFHSTDIYSAGQLPLAVVRPASTADVAQVVQLAIRNGVAVVPRGGGASYTEGYAPAEPGSLLLDTSRMDANVEHNERDM
jgi:FAD/FMN-containing dehydrogenase